MSEYQDYNFKTASGGHHLRYITPVLLKLLGDPNGKIILDIGCGNGALVNYLLDLGYDIYGIDASESGIQLAKQVHPERFFLQDITSGALPDQLNGIHFNTLISTEVIEHLYNPRQYIHFCKSILPDGGQLLISTPYHGYLKNLLLALSGKLDNHFTALWDGGHIKFWSRKTLTTLLQEGGFRVADFRGAGRIPLMWKSMVIKASLNNP